MTSINHFQEDIPYLAEQSSNREREAVDIEREVPGCEENEIRRRRKNFYLRNGYSETEVRYRWQDEAYEILVSGGTLSGEDFGNFWKALGIKKNTTNG